MPTSPNSLTMTATRRPCSAVRMRLRRVVLPEPRNPVRMTTGAFGLSKVGAEGMLIRWIPGLPHASVVAASLRRDKVRRPPAAAPRRCRSVDDRGLHLANHLADRFAVFHLHVAAHDGIDRQTL